MQKNSSHSKINQNHAKYLWFLLLSFIMLTILFNWFDSQLIYIARLNINASTFILPFTFSISALITEIYGYKHARLAVWYGLFFNLLFISYEYIITQMPNPDYATNNSLFDNLLTTNIRVFFASTISYLIAQTINIGAMAKMKIQTRGQKIDLRFLTSISIAVCANSFIFNILTFNEFANNISLLSLTFSMWLISNLIFLVILPLVIILAKKLKQIEKLDVFDTRTYFNMFSLMTTYNNAENKFGAVDDYTN